MDLQNLLSFNYWFAVKAAPFQTLTLRVLLVLMVAVLVVAVILSVRRRKLADRLLAKTYGKYSNWLYSFGIVGLIFLFFRQEQILYLGMRIFFALWLLACLIWLIFILRYQFSTVPRLKAEKQKKLDLEKYLPK